MTPKQRRPRRAIPPRKTSTMVAVAIITISLILLVLLGVGGSITSLHYVDANTASRHKVHYFGATSVPHIGFESRWNVIHCLHDITESLTLCTKSIKDRELRELVHSAANLREIVNTGEEALQNAPAGGRNSATGRSDIGPITDANRVSRGWIFDYIVEQERQRIRDALAARIDNLLASRGSPLTGLGKDFVWAQERTGVSASLMVGLTAAESAYGTDGYLCIQNHNCFGMKWNERVPQIQNGGGWCWWPDYGSSIQGAADFIIAWWGRAQTAYDLMGYCQGNPPSWIQTVEGTRRGI